MAFRLILTGFAAFLTAAAFTTTAIHAQDLKPKWPRIIKADSRTVVIYQPQVEKWDDHKLLHVRSAVSVSEPGRAEPAYGVLKISAKTDTDFDAREVEVANRSIKDITFPGETGMSAAHYAAIVRANLSPKDHMTVPLDMVVASLERSKEVASQVVNVSFAPPPVFRSETPAILVMFIDKPVFEPVVENELLFATNTNWDVFLHAPESRYYLRNDMSWLMTKDVVKGPWEPAGKLPAPFAKLPNKDDWKDVRKAMPGSRPVKAPTVFVSTRPAEMILTQGKPQFTPISDTRVLYLTNGDSNLFMVGNEYYYLIAGRWFRSASLDGPWLTAQSSLPEDFKRIPSDHVKADVLASVPGTPEAEEAILLAKIPRQVTVSRKAATVNVSFEGDPKFVKIEKTKVSYAVNSPNDVFKVDGDDRFFCCYQGVWFVAKSPKGPWAVADSIPNEIYTIPATSPKHNVTYVYVYDSTPDVVVVGYTSGYVGCYVAAGVVLFGAGYWYYHAYHHHHYYGYHCHAHYYGYGCHAHYNYYSGQYYRASSAYGPYGGVGRSASYNPATGTYRRSAAAYGPYQSRYAQQAYNPRTNTYAARRGGSTPYGSWSQTAVRRGNKWARGGTVSDSRGTAKAFKTSGGAKGIGGKRPDGTGGGIVKTRSGDIYAGKDGNIYKRGSDGTWQKHEKGRWQSASAQRGNQPRTSDRARSTSPNRSRSSVQRNLNRSHRARSRSYSSRSSRYGRSSRGYGGSSGRSRGGGGRR